MSEVRHGNLIDCSSRVVLTRWWRLGILSVASVLPRWLLTFPEKRALGIAAYAQDKAGLQTRTLLGERSLRRCELAGQQSGSGHCWCSGCSTVRSSPTAGMMLAPRALPYFPLNEAIADYLVMVGCLVIYTVGWLCPVAML